MQALELMNSGTGLIALITVATLASLVVVLGNGRGGQLKRIKDRLESLKQSQAPEISIVVEPKDDDSESGRPRGGYLLAALNRRYIRIGGAIAVPQLVLAGLVAGVIAYVLAVQVFRLQPLMALAPSALAFAFGFRTLRARKENKRRQTFLNAFPDAIDLIVRAVRAGIPVTETMYLVAEEAAPAVALEFRKMSDEMALGVDMQQALNDAAERVGAADFNFFVVSLMLQRETGGHLAETLENLGGVIRRRKEMRLKIKALTSEGRTSAKIVGGVPFIAIGAIMVLRPEYIFPFFSDPTGRIMLATAAGMIATGIMTIQRMTRTPE